MNSITKILGIGVLSLAGLIGCSGKHLPLCDGGNLDYKTLEVLAYGTEGQVLLKIDGNLYMRDNECISDYTKSENVQNIAYSIEGNRRVLTINYKDGSILKNIWEYGTFRKEHIIK